MTKKLFIDTAEIEALARVLKEADLSEIELEENGRRLKLARQIMSTTVAHSVAPSAVEASVARPSETSDQSPSSKSHGSPLKSPMVGTVYLAPEPGAAPFLKVGDKVTEGQTAFIIEAMKVMNHVKIHKSGVVKEVLVNDGDPVEFDQVLLIVE